MPGLTDIFATMILNDTVSIIPATSGGNRFLALFTAAPLNSAGAGGTEVSGTGYARARLTGQVGATASWALGATTIQISAPPAWLTTLGTPGAPAFGCNVYDTAGGVGSQIGTVASIFGTTLTLQAPALHASVGSNDGLLFCAFPLASGSVGAEPTTTAASITNGSQINFPQAGAGGWGTVVAWGIYDALSAGNIRFWDYLGPWPWLPATSQTSNPSQITAQRHGFSANTPFAVTAKPGGTMPTFTQSNLTNNVGTLLASIVSADVITATNAGVTVVASTNGNFMLRGLSPQSIAAGILPQFPPGSFVINAA